MRRAPLISVALRDDIRRAFRHIRKHPWDCRRFALAWAQEAARCEKEASVLEREDFSLNAPRAVVYCGDAVAWRSRAQVLRRLVAMMA
jgi:hypothetical protein